LRKDYEEEEDSDDKAEDDETDAGSETASAYRTAPAMLDIVRTEVSNKHNGKNKLTSADIKEEIFYVE
jgi:hypothetical protein